MILRPERPINPDSGVLTERKRNAGKLRGIGYKRGYQDEVPTTPENTQTKGPLCGVKRSGKSSSGPGTCCNPAGMGTDHLGFGPCWRHWGNTPPLNMKYTKEMIMANMRRYYGGRRNIDPHTALLEEVQFTAGHVRWLRDTIRWLGGDADADTNDPKNTNFDEAKLESLNQITNVGLKPSIYLELYQAERRHLITAAKAAIGAGVAERTVRLAEDQGRLIAQVVNAIFTDPRLELTPAQHAAAPGLAREHLLAQAGRQSDNADGSEITQKHEPWSDDEIVDADIVEEEVFLPPGAELASRVKANQRDRERAQRRAKTKLTPTPEPQDRPIGSFS